MADSIQLDVTIPSDTSQGSEVQEQILGFMERFQYTDRDVFGMRLALEEGIVNAIKHGNQLDPEKTVRIQCSISAAQVTVEIEDQGEGFNPEDVPDPTDEENLEKASGRGLMLMRAFMTSVTYSGRGNRVCLVKDRSVE